MSFFMLMRSKFLFQQCITLYLYFFPFRNINNVSTRPKESWRRCPTSVNSNSQKCTFSGNSTLSSEDAKRSSTSSTLSISTAICQSRESKVGNGSNSVMPDKLSINPSLPSSFCLSVCWYFCLSVHSSFQFHPCYNSIL